MIVELTKNDIEKIEKLAKVFSEIFKNKDEIINDFNDNIFSKYFIYFEKSNIIGFVNYYDLYDRFEIANIVVLPEHRNKKVGSKLIENLIKIGQEKKIVNITLEVRCNNEYAVKLYKKYAFEEVAIRKNYYNGIDGILMERKMM